MPPSARGEDGWHGHTLLVVGDPMIFHLQEHMRTYILQWSTSRPLRALYQIFLLNLPLSFFSLPFFFLFFFFVVVIFFLRLKPKGTISSTRDRHHPNQRRMRHTRRVPCRSAGSEAVFSTRGMSNTFLGFRCWIIPNSKAHNKIR